MWSVLLKTQHIYSPQMQLHLLEASFTNVKGGLGNNAETDLVMGHSIRNIKDLICSLGAKKTEKAIICATLAAYSIANISHQFNNAIGVQRKTGRHAKFISEADRKT